MDIKTCSTCRQEKTIDNFWKRKLKTGTIIYQAVCKECSTKRRVEYYIDNKEKETDLRKNRSIKIKEWFLEFKKTLKCSRCAESRWYVLDFHHISDKEINIAEAINGRYSIDRIKNEIAKCIVLCSNCHRDLHYHERINTAVI